MAFPIQDEEFKSIAVDGGKFYDNFKSSYQKTKKGILSEAEEAYALSLETGSKVDDYSHLPLESESKYDL